MEGLINVQKEIQKGLDRGLINFKKSPKDRITVEYIEARLENLEKDWTLFRKNNTKLHESFDADAVQESDYITYEIYDRTEDTYFTYKSLMKTALNEFRVNKNGSIHELESSFKGSVNQSCSFVKLPKISIPTFSGKYSEWTTFRDLFVSLVDKNTTIDNVQKLHYLKAHLTGEAEQLIRQTPITDANYTQCWSQLEKRYNNRKYLASCILKRLFGIKRMNVESSSSLKDIIDTTTDCLNALINLNIDVSTWDVIVIHMVTYKLDSETRKQWELNVCCNDSNDLPTFNQFKTFIENRFRALECIEPKKTFIHQVHSSSQPQYAKSMLATDSTNIRCEYCSERHKLCFCKQFAKQPLDSRREFVLKNKICFNCLGSNHNFYDCNKPTTCRLCKRRHHSLLHPEGSGVDGMKGHNVTSSKSASVDSASTSTSATPIVSCLSLGKIAQPRQVLLATALINAESKTGQLQIVRALLDQGSQACFITEATVQFLRLKKIPVHGTITGLGNNKPTVAKSMVNLKIQSRFDSTFKLEIKAYVLSNITSYLPERIISTTGFEWGELNNLYLADPKFRTPNKIDILLGAEVYSCIMKEGLKRNPSGNLIAQSTTLGWILTGIIHDNNNIKELNTFTKNISVMHAQVKEDELLKRFWELEEQPISSGKILTPEEQRCEEYYASTTRKDKDGRYVVRLPFRDPDPTCVAGNSRDIAEKRFISLEKRLSKDKKLKDQYVEVINSYLHLDHMKPVKENIKKEGVWLPQHAVIRNDKTTTQVRVVFNASEKNSKGVSLNDNLMVGPTLQADLRHTVLKWRVYAIGLVADIVKMYRQIRVAEEDLKYQRILWRDSPEKKIIDYELMTVTFGVASAPYLAVRTLHQIALDGRERYPLASDKVLNCFYMDDLMTGCYNVEEGLDLYREITGLLSEGGFSMQKWNSNRKELVMKIRSIENKGVKDKSETGQNKYINEGKNNLKNILNNQDNKEERIIEEKIDQQEKDNIEVEIKLDSTIKILGLSWNREQDCFQYTVSLQSNAAPVTKRTVIADIARLFDPLGWLAPSVVLAKIFIQKLWLAGMGWDEVLDKELIKEWNTYRTDLQVLTKIRIPRWLGTNASDELELHGFSDACKSAYSAVVYVRVVDAAANVKVALLAAKTRVAPIKQISIPRLELCGAVLVSRLLIETAEVLNIPREKIRAWTDSTVVLAWLNSHPSRWKTFVGNRVSEILTSFNSSQWFHVSSSENPADCASRGLLPSMLAENTCWFDGPRFLKNKTIVYKRPRDLDVNLEQSVRIHVAITQDNSLFDRCSSLRKLLKIIAYCRRFLYKNTKRSVYIQKQELDDALQTCIKMAQREVYYTEFIQLQDNGYLKLKSSKIKSLCPFLDNKGIIRVRGRLEKSQLDEQTKHPIILPSSSQLTKLIIADAHHKTLHGGPQLMSNYLRTAYWIPGTRNLVKHYVYNCVTCAKQRADIKNQMMGSLPTVRCTPARPFLHSGVDYAGPINIRTTTGRGHRAYKGYICLFVCMATRAIHLEVVSDMSTQRFLAAFRRFVSRRGHCAQLWSDNGTTFVGASRELQQLVQIQASIAEHLEANGTEWHFIPPHAPNFGGLWEAGVKSTKYHLKRVIGEATLTYEEISTLLTQVEACLNSRPISIVNCTDPGEPLPLTPGHFLIGEPLINVPDATYETSNVNYLTRWQLVQRMLQTFWRRWSQEYLCNLMNRYKWSAQVPEPTVGDIVLIKEDDMPPSRWLLGRILQKHPGDDNITRVVTVRTKSSTVKRPTSKLCILPVVQ